MRLGKTVRPDNIPIEVWKCLADKGKEWLTNLIKMTLL